ncbi:MAG: alpha/beta hydrolase [Gammaproteobacteria bacterium]|nr:alpha/beta hydrolase [Gammaproteobacteria bacterium]MYF37858.1 alpha/beta hydrolase [Gammaproteobacteria bacterium]
MFTFRNRLFAITLMSVLSSILVYNTYADYDTTTGIQFRELPGIEPSHQSLDYFRPLAAEGEEAPSNLPVILYVHGGRWMIGDKDIDQSPFVEYFTDQGFVVVSTNYRLSEDGKNQHPAQIEDVADAVGWISDNIRYRSGNPRAIYLIGHGAGAHLVALLATDHSRLIDVGVRPVDIKGVVLLEPLVLDLVETMQSSELSKEYHKAAFGDNLEVWQDASPYFHIREDFPIVPHLIVAACPVGWPSPEHLNKLKTNHWSAIEHYTKKLQENDVRVDVVNAMQYQSFRAVDRDLGTAGDQTTEVIASFISELESHRTERNPVPTEGVVHTLKVEGEEWKEAAQELGNVVFDLWNFDNSRDLNTPIPSDALPEDLQQNFVSWDTNNDKSLDREEIQAAFEALYPD